jgi:hypothetical protein
MLSFFGTQWQAGVPSRQFTILYADDMVNAPSIATGLMSKIMILAFKGLATEGYEYVLNLSAGSVTLRSSMGWRSAGCVHPT